MSLENPGGKRWWRNGYACECMVLSIEDVIEPRLRAAGHLGDDQWVPVFQYAYSGGVSASAGTHDGGGAIDHDKGNDAETIIWRECGVADWQRGSPQDTAFDPHNHGIWQGCPHTSSGADDQLDQYRAGCSGLSGWGPDQSPYVKPISWQDAYRKYANAEPPEPEGILGMSELNRQHAGKDRVIKPNDDWWVVLINDDGDSSFLTGPATFSAEAFVQATGLSPSVNDQLRVRFGRYHPDNDHVDLYPQVEVPGSGGTTFFHTSLIGWIPDKLKLRLYVNTSVQVTLTDVQANVLFEKDK